MTKPYLMAAIVLLFLTMVSICYMSLTLSEQSRSHPGGIQHESNDKIRKLLAIMDFNEECQCGKDLKKRIEQALDIKDSAQRELRQIEKKLTDLRKQESELIRTIDELKSNATHEKTNFETLSMKIEQAKFALTELAERNTPELKPPLRLKALPKDNFIGQDNTKSVPDCTFGSCFDLSRCSLSSGYPVLVRCPEDQNPTNWAIQNLVHPVDQLGCKISYDLQLPYSWKKLVSVRVGGCSSSRNTTRIALHRIKIDQLMHNNFHVKTIKLL